MQLHKVKLQSSHLASLEDSDYSLSKLKCLELYSIESEINLKGYPVVIYDTAGITVSNDKVEQEGMKKAKELIKKADIVLNI